jgi:hypothetical protein
MQTDYSAQEFSRMICMEKNGPSVWDAIIGCMKPVGSRGTTVSVPCTSRVVSYMKKILLSHIRAPFEFQSEVRCTETCMLLQNVIPPG